MGIGYFGIGFGVNRGYLLAVLISAVIGFAAQAYIKSTYRKWSGVQASIDGTGRDVARRMLDEGGASNIGITRVRGTLTDYFDPRDEMLHLSNDNYRGASVASLAVACHEAGHALQRSKGYGMYKVRTALVPVVNFAQSCWSLVLIAGIFFKTFGLVQVAIGLYAATVLFWLVTLPVEIDASRRAVAYLKEHGSELDYSGAKSVLIAAAMTYVAGALSSIIQLVYLLLRYGGNRNSR